MKYMIMIYEESSDPGLVPYTGVVHDTKREALREFIEAVVEIGRRDYVYLTIV